MTAPHPFEPTSREATDVASARALLGQVEAGHRLAPSETISLIDHATDDDLFAAANRVHGAPPRRISMPGRRNGILLRARQLHCRQAPCSTETFGPHSCT